MRLLANHTEYARAGSGPTFYMGNLCLKDASSFESVQLTRRTIRALSSVQIPNATVIVYNAPLPQRETIISYELVAGNGKTLSLSDVGVCRVQVCRAIAHFLARHDVDIVEFLPAAPSRV